MKLQNKTLICGIFMIVPSLIFGVSIKQENDWFPIIMMLILCVISGICAGIYLVKNKII